MSGQKRALILVRESNENLAAGWSPDEYVAKCRRKAAELGAEVIEPPLIEVGKRNEWDSPKLLSAIERAKAGEYQYLISPDTARLAGDLGKLLWIKKELASAGVEIRYATIDFAQGAEGDLHEIMVGAFDQYERVKIAMRFANGRTGKIDKGLPNGSGKAPYGTQKVRDEKGRTIGYTRHETEAPVLEWIVREARKRALRLIAADLNAQGVPTPGGKGRWTTSTIYKLIVNGHYEGVYLYGRRKHEPKRRANGERWWKRVENDPANVTETAITPLLDPAELAAAKAAMTTRRERRRSRCADEDDPFTLRGSLRCEHCDGMLSAAGRGPKRYYLCLRAYARESGVPRAERCPLPHVPAEEIETYAWAKLRALLEDVEAFEAELKRAADGGEAARRHQQQVAELKSRIGRLAQRIMNGARQLRDFDPDGETYQQLMAGQREDERQKRALDESLIALQREQPLVLDAQGVERAREQRRLLLDGLDEAGSEAPLQRALYRLLGTRGVIGLDEVNGVRLGRKHRWSIAWLDPDGGMDKVPHPWEYGTLLILTPSALRVRLVA